MYGAFAGQLDLVQADVQYAFARGDTGSRLSFQLNNPQSHAANFNQMKKREIKIMLRGNGAKPEYASMNAPGNVSIRQCIGYNLLLPQKAAHTITVGPHGKGNYAVIYGNHELMPARVRFETL